MSKDAITFDLLEGSFNDADILLNERITKEEQEEIYRVVTVLESVSSKELLDFLTDEKAPLNIRHKAITPEELDRLAGKNNSENTVYKTK